MLSRRNLLAALGLGLAIAASTGAARAENAHVAAAVRETREAIHEGKQHMFSSFVEHSHNALDHAREAVAGGFDPRNHVTMAVKHLRDALKVTKHTHSVARLEKGIHHAERALIHLKVAANEH